jgi:hypothetical protein
MKKLFLLLTVLFISVSVHAQIDNYPKVGQGNLEGGLGLNWIDGDLYYTFHINPELSFANFGVGLDLNLDIDQNGNLRKQDFERFSDYLDIIRYIRYGTPNDPVFIKVGALDYYSLGYGNIMLNYNNSPSYDARTIGLVADIDLGEFGFESIYSDFLQAGVVGVRGYIRPLKFTSTGSIPVIGKLTIGATYAGDFDKYAGIVFDQPQTNSTFVDKGSINIVGVDIGLPILSTNIFGLQLYADETKIINFGSGTAAGIKANFDAFGIINASAQFERRFNQAQYIPGYFNSFYEIERYDTAAGIYSSMATKLANMTNPDNGYFGELYANAFGLFNVTGTYERLDKTPFSGILHIEANAMPENLPFVLKAGYDKVNISSETDLFKVDNNSLLYFEYGYKPEPYLIVSILYKWTFAPVFDSNKNIIDYQPQKRIEPRVTFVYPLNFGGTD